VDLYFHFLKHLEKLRTSHGITISEFTSGIISERMYRRYLVNDAKMPTHVSEQLLAKLDYSMARYMAYLFRATQEEFCDEHYLLTLLRAERFEEAGEFVKNISLRTLRSVNRHLLLPFLILRMKYHNQKMSTLSYEIKARKILDFDNVFSFHLLYREEVEALLFFSFDLDDDNRQAIIDLILNRLQSDAIITYEPSVTRQRVLALVSRALLTKKKVSKFDLNKSRKLLVELSNTLDASGDQHIINQFLYAVTKLHLLENKQEKAKFAASYLYRSICGTNNIKYVLELLSRFDVLDLPRNNSSLYRKWGELL
jgi:hypothetical protein